MTTNKHDEKEFGHGFILLVLIMGIAVWGFAIVGLYHVTVCK